MDMSFLQNFQHTFQGFVLIRIVGLPQLKVAKKNEGFYIGWDYAHAGDQIGLKQFEWDKRWTVAEIQEEAYEVIEQLIKLVKEIN